MDYMNYGFIPDDQMLEDWVFGASAVSEEPILPDGDWTSHLPEKEIQRLHGLETMNCTVFGTLNAIESLFHKITGLNINYSERFIGVLANTTRYGNTPHNVARTITACGVIADKHLPFSEDIDTWDKYYSPKPMTKQYIEIGEEWLQYWNFYHEWVFTPSLKKSPEEKQNLIKDALKYSPLGVSVKAWKSKDGVYLKDKGDVDNHWCMLYKQDDEYNYVYDSYDNTVKKLTLDYDFQYAKRYALIRKNQNDSSNEVGLGWWNRVWKWITSFIHTLLD